MFYIQSITVLKSHIFDKQKFDVSPFCFIQFIGTVVRHFQ